jgi:hypothetical protein
MDDELDRTAPFSFAFGASVTAQFVLEDLFRFSEGCTGI